MTDEEYEKAKKLIEKRNYYMELARQVAWEKYEKERADEKAKRRHDAWTLLSYFSVRFWNRKDGQKKKATIGVLSHYEFAQEIEIDADKELIDIIWKWLMSKCEELEKQINEI